MKIKLRPFSKKYAEDFSKIICKCADNSLDMGKESREFVKSKNTSEELIKKSKNTKLILAFVNGKVVGGGGIQKNKIRTMFVDIKHQGRGIGRKIYKKLEEMARKGKIKKLWLCASPNALNFYKKLGFKKIKKDKFGSILMEKKLT